MKKSVVRTWPQSPALLTQPLMDVLPPSVSEKYAFLFWWDTLFIVGGYLIATIFFMITGYALAKRRHLTPAWNAPALSFILGLLSIILALVIQATGLSNVSLLAYPMGALLVTSPYLVFIESKKERLTAFLFSLLFVTASWSMLQLVGIATGGGS